MSYLNAPSPRPKSRPNVSSGVRFANAVEEQLASPDQAVKALFADVVLRRRSGSRFHKVGRDSLTSLLWYSVRTQAVNQEDPVRELRPVPSAGALHPIHLLLSSSPAHWERYVARSHAIAGLQVDKRSAESIWAEVRDILDPGEGIALLLLADLGLARAYYDHPDTLLFRDSGCLLGHLGLVAEALGLSFRILGPTGEPWASDLIVGVGGLLVGVGLAVVGGRACDTPGVRP